MLGWLLSLWRTSGWWKLLDDHKLIASQRKEAIEDLVRYQDVIGQLPFLKSYTHFLLTFPVPDDAARGRIVQDLESAALKLTETFPWLAAQVVQESGGFRLKTCNLWAHPRSIVRVKDCSHQCPSYGEIKEREATTSQFNANILAPTVAFPSTYVDSEENPAPVAVIQANFIRGGLLLDSAAQHNFMDGRGLINLLRMLAKILRGEQLTEMEVKEGNRDRRSLIPLLGTGEPLRDHSHLRRPPPPLVPPPARAPSPWVLFRFSAASVATIKALASINPSVPFITSNDALSAFCWQRVTTARQRLKYTPQAVAKFCRAVDVRRAMGVPTEYMGHMVYIAVANLTFEEIENSSLAFIASALHKSVTDVNNEYTVRSFATLIANEPDRSTISFGGRFNPDTDIGSSSFARMRIHDANFGRLGRPDHVRRPNFGPLESDIYTMPQLENGDIELLMCFTEKVFETLKADPEWAAYAQYLG